MPNARFPSRTPPPTDATYVALLTTMSWKFSRSMTSVCERTSPPEEKEAYEWPPDLAWTGMLRDEAQRTAAEIWAVVVGRTTARGTKGRRALKVVAWRAQAVGLGEEGSRKGMEEVVRQVERGWMSLGEVVAPRASVARVVRTRRGDILRWDAEDKA